MLLVQAVSFFLFMYIKKETSDVLTFSFAVAIRPLMQRPMLGPPGVRPSMRPVMGLPVRPSTIPQPLNRPPAMVSPQQANLVAPLQNMQIQSSPQVKKKSFFFR